MAEDIPLEEIEELTTPEHFSNQTNPGRRFKPYSFTMGLRKAMKYIEPEDIQELKADRDFGLHAELISEVSSSKVSKYVEGKDTHGRSFEIDYDRAEHGPFDWSEVQDLLGRPSTLHDVPVRRLVLRFDDDEFESEWISYIEEAIDVTDTPTDWIQPPFFAVLESAKPGESDAREGLRRMHEEFYFKPEAKATRGDEGFPWNPVTLDLEAIWSYNAFIRDDEPIMTNWAGDEDWTARKLEQVLMNYFNPRNRYSGRIYNSAFTNSWRQQFSLEATSTKVFQWQEDEEWEQQPDLEPDF